MKWEREIARFFLAMFRTDSRNLYFEIQKQYFRKIYILLFYLNGIRNSDSELEDQNLKKRVQP